MCAAAFLFQAFRSFICGVWAELGGREEVAEKKVAHYQISSGFKWQEMISTDIISA